MGLHRIERLERRNDTGTSSGDRVCGQELTASVVDGIADAFAALIDRYGQFFRTCTRNSAAAAARYLRGLAQAEVCKFTSMAVVVAAGCAQQFQHFISNSPWDHEPVIAQISRDADQLPGGKPESCLIIDECNFPKQGDRSVGVARQWSGCRLIRSLL